MLRYKLTVDVLAEEMTRQEYREVRQGTRENELDNDKGYIIEYVNTKANMPEESSFLSWMPAKVFHSIAKVNVTKLERINIEIDELKSKINNNEVLINNHAKVDYCKYNNLSPKIIDSIKEEIVILKSHLDLLVKRRDYFKGW